MATLKFLVLSMVCLCVHALPHPPTQLRNTIFLDEKLEGEIFENLFVSSYEDEISVFSDTANPYRLPTTTKPVNYNVLWNINIETLTFSGTVEIDLVATQEDVNQIVIHTEDLNYYNYTLEVLLDANTTDNVNEREYIDIVVYEDVTYSFMYINLTEEVLEYNPNNAVTYRFTVSFDAELRDDMYGIYKSWFKNNYTESEVSWMATTQFQATAARRAFPCYDEPSFKATFNIRIRRPETHSSWSCTRISETLNSTELGIPGYEEDVYYTTPIMSTYLIAIIVAEYDSLNDSDDGNSTLTFEVISRPGAMNETRYAFDVGQELLKTMSEHTAIDYYSVNPNLKMTQASIPDFSAGAMENWGLLTYREAYLLYNEEHTNNYFKQLIAYILSHEIAHMWFGNLVTCDWWDVLWLNEGFARYYQYFLTHWVEDYMGLETRFITEQVHTSLLTDSANNPQPLNNPGVGSPAQVSSMFSTISYNKGAAVIRMTEHLLGHEVHREGLRRYLQNRYLDTALPIDLYEALQEAGVNANALEQYGPDFSIIEYYKTWTDQPGHPVLNVQVNHNTGDMTITQRRFNINTGVTANNNHWIIPITFATASNPDFNNTKPTHIIDQTLTVINRGSIGNEWVIFNNQQIGFYRVNYDDLTWNLIVNALRSDEREKIHEYNRAQIVNDVFQFARSGLMSYSRAFNILSFLQYERSYAPWVAAITGFTWIRNRLVGTPYLEPFEKLIADWANGTITDLGYVPAENEDFMVSYLRYQLAPFLCLNNYPGCREAAAEQLQRLIEDGEEVPVNNRNWVYCNGLREGTNATFDYLWERFQYHNVYTERIVLLMTLGCTNDEESLNTYLEAITEDSETKLIRPQDTTTAYNSAVSGNEANTQITLRFIQNNLERINNTFSSISVALSYVAARLRSESEVDEFLTWVEDSREILGNTTVNNAYSYANSVIDTIQWVNSVGADLSNYFENGDDELDITTPIPDPVTLPSTVTEPDLVEPTTPDLDPDSAVTTFLSIFVVSLAVVANIVL